MKKLFFFALGLGFLFSCQQKEKKEAKVSPQSNVSANQKKEQESPLGKISSLKKNLEWTAYKTPEKVAVQGTFRSITLVNTNEAEPNLEKSLENSDFYCDVTTVSTEDASRDGTLGVFFFKRLNNPTLKGKFGKFENNQVPISLTFNGVTIDKKFPYILNNNELTISGSIDILNDFKADRAYKSLHKACFDLHKGKTWTEVDFKATISK